jgi:hypothetical protein
MDDRIKFENAIVYAKVDVLKEMVEQGNLIVVRRHVKFAKKMQKLCATPETNTKYIEMVDYLKSKCKCTWFL